MTAAPLPASPVKPAGGVNPPAAPAGSIIPERGERALIVGQTGSGKTGFATWLLKRIPTAPIVIYDTKIEPKFEALGHSIVVPSVTAARGVIDQGEHDYIIVRPADDLLHDHEALDGMLYSHYMHLQGIDAYIDETYSFHSAGGRAGKGLIALLTRGRSKGITTIMSTQRPVHLSRFALTEAQRFYIFWLGHEDDHKTIAKIIPGFDKLKPPPEYYFYYYNNREKQIKLFKPVKLDEQVAAGYTDTIETETDHETVSKLSWL